MLKWLDDHGSLKTSVGTIFLYVVFCLAWFGAPTALRLAGYASFGVAGECIGAFIVMVFATLVVRRRSLSDAFFGTGLFSFFIWIPLSVLALLLVRFAIAKLLESAPHTSGVIHAILLLHWLSPDSITLTMFPFVAVAATAIAVGLLQSDLRNLTSLRNKPLIVVVIAAATFALMQAFPYQAFSDNPRSATLVFVLGVVFCSSTRYFHSVWPAIAIWGLTVGFFGNEPIDGLALPAIDEFLVPVLSIVVLLIVRLLATKIRSKESYASGYYSPSTASEPDSALYTPPIVASTRSPSDFGSFGGGSNHVETRCTNCNGYGRMQCPSCHGSGYAGASLFDAANTQTCIICGGQGEINCPSCH